MLEFLVCRVQKRDCVNNRVYPLETKINQSANSTEAGRD